MARGTVPVHIPTLLACSLFASKDEKRFYICGVYVESRKGGMLYCATDGHRLLARFVEDEEIKTSDFMIIPAAVCKLFKIEDDEVPNGKLTFGAGQASIFYNDVTVSFEPVQGTFPHFGAVVPSEFSGEPSQFNGKYVHDFDKAAKIMNAGDPVFHHNGTGPCPVTFMMSDAVGVLMPMSKDAEAYERPEWLDRTKGTGDPLQIPEPETAQAPSDSPVADNCAATAAI